MDFGFLKVAAVTPNLKVAECKFNTDEIIKTIVALNKSEVKIAVFPELAISGYTCGELFLQDKLITRCKKELARIQQETRLFDILVIVGLPFENSGKLYNVAAVIKGGELLGIVPKLNLPEYSELYERRYFAIPSDRGEVIPWRDNRSGFTYFGTRLIFEDEEDERIKIGIEICEDLWVASSPSNSHTSAGATIIANLSASPETYGKDRYRRELVRVQSEKLISGYIYATSGDGESSTDLVFGGHNIICENGEILSEKKRFENGYIVTDIDLDRINFDRRRVNTFISRRDDSYHYVNFSFIDKKSKLQRKFTKTPFLSEIKAEKNSELEEILEIQTAALKKRYSYVSLKHAIIGVSGGLDSTLALFVVARTFDKLKIDRKNIIAVTMPGFGTTDRTYENAKKLIEKLGATLKEIDIKEAVSLHLKAIGHSGEHNSTYENAQARERTQILMDLANEYSGLVIGTGDLSELAMGFATYNGDHMSMYGVNSSIPKTVVRELVLYLSKNEKDKEVSELLTDIYNTPISPELLEAIDGVSTQNTEEIVGPYELVDFFLYHLLRWGASPEKINYLAKEAFVGKYTEETIMQWNYSFYKRFFKNAYKRSCLPDGIKVGEVSLSPRGDFRMPSDAENNIWLR